MNRFPLSDWTNLLSKLSWRRFINACKVLCSYYYSKWTGKAVQWGLPISISFEPTTSC
ncbi:MAG: radical SAM protein, partial [Chitinophagaceae bacterium]|nr:radical SAM protein [Chitinophagaceae bacterium]